MNLFSLAVKNLAQRPVRTLITGLSIAVAVAVLFVLVSFNRGYEKSLRNQIQQMGIHALVIPVGCPYEAASLVLKGGKIPNFLPEAVADRVGALAGVEIAAPSLISGIVRPAEGRTDIFLGIDERMLKLKNWWHLTGRFFTGPDDMILGADAAQVELSHVGDQIYVPELDHTFTVVGELAPTGTEDDGFFYVPLATAQRLFNKPDQITATSIRFTDPRRAAGVTTELEKISGAEVVTMSELLGTMMNLVGSAKALIFSIVLIAIVISTLGVLNTILMSVFERTREIGILRATGAGKVHVFALIWLESVLLSVSAGVVGLGLAAAGARLLEKLIKGILPLAPKASVVSLEPSVFALCFGFVLAMGILAGVYPAWHAARARPIESLRTE